MSGSTNTSSGSSSSGSSGSISRSDLILLVQKLQKRLQLVTQENQKIKNQLQDQQQQTNHSHANGNALANGNGNANANGISSNASFHQRKDSSPNKLTDPSNSTESSPSTLNIIHLPLLESSTPTVASSSSSSSSSSVPSMSPSPDSDASEEIRRLQSSLASAQREIETLRSSSSFSFSSSPSSSHDSELKKLQSSYEEKEKRIQELTLSLSQAEARCKQQQENQKRSTMKDQQEIKQLQIKIKQLEKPATSPSDQKSCSNCEAFKTENREANVQLNSWKTKCEVLTKERDAALSSLASSSTSSSFDHLQSSHTALLSEHERVKRECMEYEQKLSSSDARLVKTFQLLTAEKSRVAQLEKQCEEGQKKLEQTMVEHKEIVKTQQLLMTSKQQQYEQASSELTSLKEKLKRMEVEAEGFVDLRRNGQRLMEENREIREELEHERGNREREKQQREMEMEMEKEEREREREERQTELLKWEREKREQLERLQSQLTDLTSQLQASTARNSQLSLDYNVSQSSSSVLEQQCKELKEEVEAGRTAHVKEMNEMQQQLAREEKRQGERYERLHKELKQYREQASEQIHQQTSTIEELKQQLSQLQEEISLGAPAERRIFELAQLQARREENIRKLETEILQLRSKLTDYRSKVKVWKQEREWLQEQVRVSQESRSRESVNVDYLKSVFVKLLQFESMEQHQQRVALIPVIAQILQFSKQEMKIVQQIMKQAQNISTGANGGGWTKWIGMGMGMGLGAGTGTETGLGTGIGTVVEKEKTSTTASGRSSVFKKADEDGEVRPGVGAGARATDKPHRFANALDDLSSSESEGTTRALATTIQEKQEPVSTSK